MLTDVWTQVLALLIISAFGFWVGILIFKNDQKNKNEAIKVKFENVDKDISKNDHRLRLEMKKEFLIQQKQIDKVVGDVSMFENRLVKNVNDMIEVKTMIIHLDKSMDEINKKVDAILSYSMRQQKNQQTIIQPES